MAEKITNGAFTTNLSGWSNTGDHNFAWSSGRARAVSDTVSNDTWYSCLVQSFTKTGTTLTALLTVWENHIAPAGAFMDGSVRYVVDLYDPDGEVTHLADETYTGESASGYLRQNENIAAYLTKNGTYELRLKVYATAAENEGSYSQSRGELDNVSLVVTEKFTKTVMESFGAAESKIAGIEAETSEDLGFVEALTSVGGQSGANPTQVVETNPLGMVESLAKLVKKTVLEALGAAETFARTYGYCAREIPGDSVGFVESISAKVTAGNVTRIVTDLQPKTQWTDIVPVTTNWEQEG